MGLRVYLYSFLFLLVLSCSNEAVVNADVAGNDDSLSVVKPNRITYINSNRLFNDLNDTHLAEASKIGIEPLASRDGIPSASKKLYLVGGPMRYNEPFVIDELKHSSPFLVKEARDLLHVIGRNFQDSLERKGLPAYSIIVSSVLRTDADVKSLSRSNVNASKRSVHCYGTTVDVSYRRFEKHDDEGPDAKEVALKAVLAEVLRDLREEGRCYVKYEIKQACFHITARK